LEKPYHIILGIDPGTLIMGYGLIRVCGRNPEMLDMGILKLDSHRDHYIRLQLIHEKVMELIQLHQPDGFAIEAPFFGKNVQSMLKLGRAQGVAIAAAMHSGISVMEYSPRKVKQSIVGNGNATKEQVWQMLQRILSLNETLPYMDASDAIAVAVCHCFQQSSPHVKSTAGGWKDFLQKHPDKIAPSR
jgi:crossover junction endodeoxyribonuclease RuvC